MQNWQQTVISEYGTAPTINTLIYCMNQWKDPSANINSFYNMIFNIDTAEGYGLDVWGRILGVGRVLQITATDPYWGYHEASTLSAWPYNPGGGIFYNGEQLTGNYPLTDAGFRVLLMAKAAFNICSGSSQGINALLLALFPGRGNAYVVDNRNMSMTYVFDFTPTPVEVAIIQQSGVLPRPTGVSVSYTIP
jgi:hypothetical protein